MRIIQRIRPKAPNIAVQRAEQAPTASRSQLSTILGERRSDGLSNMERRFLAPRCSSQRLRTPALRVPWKFSDSESLVFMRSKKVGWNGYVDIMRLRYSGHGLSQHLLVLSSCMHPQLLPQHPCRYCQRGVWQARRYLTRLTGLPNRVAGSNAHNILNALSPPMASASHIRPLP